MKEISIRDLFNGYINSNEEGVFGYGGLLNIRPKYQREFVYHDPQRDAVIDTVLKGFPLNVMYWVENNDGTFEVLDGQQRTISICSFVNNDFSITIEDHPQYFHSLPEDYQNQILDYKLMVYFCEGDPSEKLEWFRVINTAGEKLTNQELLNAIYAGEWLTDAKRHFSRTNGPAYDIAGNYLIGTANRQQYLETALDWISDGNIEKYMAYNQREPNANELWLFFQNVINWVKILFPKYRKEMKGINWGALYKKYKDKKFDSKILEEKVSALMMDDDVTKKSGIYSYLITGEERYLNIRSFTDNMKREVYERQQGICPRCIEPDNRYILEDMEADHITPWHEGGKTNADNCQMLCQRHNREKSGK